MNPRERFRDYDTMLVRSKHANALFLLLRILTVQQQAHPLFAGMESA
jgi:hypothetical protein